MKNSWLVWVFIVGVVLTVLIAFNYQGSRETIPLSEIFPETETYPVQVEYEFVDDNEEQATQAAEQKKSDAFQQIAKPAPQAKKEVQQIAKQAAEQSISKAQAASSVVDLSKSSYTIQVASFKKKERAEQKLEELKKKEYQGFVVSKDLKDKGTWHRVYVGQFELKTDADQYLTQIRKDYSSSFVISLK